MKIDKYKLVCIIPLLGIVFDFIVLHFAPEDSNMIQYIRAVFMYSLIGYLLYPKIPMNHVSVSIFLFIIYVIGIVIFRSVADPSELLLGLTWVARIAIGLLMAVIAFKFINTSDRLHYLNIFTILTGISIILYFAIVNVFDIGVNMYFRNEYLIEDTGIIRTGLLGGVNLNAISIILIIAPLLIYTSYHKIKYDVVVSLALVTLFIILLLVLRRSAIVIVLFGYAYYGLYLKQLGKKFRRNIALGILFLIVLSPIYTPYVISMYEIRGEKVISSQAFDQDTRSSEITYMVNDIMTSNDYSYKFFGESFNTTGAFPLSNDRRPLHSDITVLLYITGFIGFFLYLVMHFSFLKYGFKYKKYLPRIYFHTLLVLVVSSILLMYPGRLDGIVYRSIMFLYIGSIMGTMHKNYLERRLS